MDHKSFDDRFKEKLEGLNPSYQPSSWDNMEDMLTYGIARPWYYGWQAASMIAGLALFSLINFYFLWEIRKERSISQNQLPSIPQQTVVVDTIYIADTIYVKQSKSLSNSDHTSNRDQRITDRSITVHNSSFANQYTRPIHTSNVFASSNYKPSNSIFSGAGGLTTTYVSPSIGGDLLSGSSLVDDATIQRPDNVPLIYMDVKDPLVALRLMALGYDIRKSGTGRDRIKRAYKPKTREIRIGLVGGILIPNPDIGERYISNKIGLASEITLKKNLSFVTGLHLGKLTYKLDEVDDNNFNPDDLSSYPGYNELGKVPDEIIINNKLLQLPLHLRYYKPLNYNWSVFVAGGPTLDLLLNQRFKYNYLDIDDDQLIVVNEVTEQKDLRLYLGNFTGSFGIEHNFTRNLAGQVSIDYQYGLGKLGVEKRSVNSLGLNLAAYYKLK